MSVHLVDSPEPLDTAALLGSLAAHAIPGAERVDLAAGTFERLLPVGTTSRHVALTFSERQIAVELGDVPPEQAHEVVTTVRRWFDLDANHHAIQQALGNDRILGPLLDERPTLGIVSNPHPVELAIVTILGQQVSLAAARTFSGRLVEAFSADTANSHPSALLPFPSPEAIRDAPTEWLRAAIGITRSRVRTVQAMAAAFADGLSFEADPQRLRSDLLALPGVGPWTVEYLALRGFHDRDAFPASDLVLRRALLSLGVTVPEVSAVAEAWRPFRAYATVHLWNHALPPASGPRSTKNLQ